MVLTLALIFLALSAYFNVLYVSSNDMADGLKKKGKTLLRISILIFAFVSIKYTNITKPI